MKAISLTGFETRPYYGKDIRDFASNNGLSASELGSVFCQGGMSSSALQKQIGNDEKLLSPPLQILLRFYLRNPETIPLPERVVASEFFASELGGDEAIAVRYRGVLFGVDRNSGYNWSRDATPISQVKSTMLAAKRLKKNRGLTQQELLTELIENLNAVTQSLGINPLLEGSWKREKNSDEVIKYTNDSVTSFSVKRKGRRVWKAKIEVDNRVDLKSTMFKVRSQLSNIGTCGKTNA